MTALPWGLSRVWDQSFTYHNDARRLNSHPEARVEGDRPRSGSATCSCCVALALALDHVPGALRRFSGAPACPRRPARPRRIVVGVPGALGRARLRTARLGTGALPRPRRPARASARVAGEPPATALDGARGRRGRGRAVLGDRGTTPSSGPTATGARSRGRAAPAAAARRRARHQRRPGPRVARRARHARQLRRPVVPAHRGRDRSPRRRSCRRRRPRDVCGVVVSSPQHFGSLDGLPARLRAEGYRSERFGDITVFDERRLPGRDDAPRRWSRAARSRGRGGRASAAAGRGRSRR